MYVSPIQIAHSVQQLLVVHAVPHSAALAGHARHHVSACGASLRYVVPTPAPPAVPPTPLHPAHAVHVLSAIAVPENTMRSCTAHAASVLYKVAAELRADCLAEGTCPLDWQRAETPLHAIAPPRSPPPPAPPSPPPPPLAEVALGKFERLPEPRRRR